MNQQNVQREREEKLADILKNRLHQYVLGNKEAFISHAEAEVSRLSNAGNFMPSSSCVFYLSCDNLSCIYMFEVALGICAGNSYSQLRSFTAGTRNLVCSCVDTAGSFWEEKVDKSVLVCFRPRLYQISQFLSYCKTRIEF